jgi:hypothetical protein
MVASAINTPINPAATPNAASRNFAVKIMLAEHTRRPANFKARWEASDLYSQEKFSPIHPKEQQPENKQGHGSEKQWRIRLAEKLEETLSEIRDQIFPDEIFAEMIYAVGGDGIHADDDQRKGPTLVILNIHQRIKSGQKKKTPTAAEEYPAWRPDTLDNRANSQPPQSRARQQANNAGDEQPSRLGP